MKTKLQCQSKTRQSGYTKQCQGVGIICKNGNIRCKVHGGYSNGQTTLEGKVKAYKNLIQFKNF